MAATPLIHFLDAVATQERAAAFCSRTGVAPRNLMALLRQLYKLLPLCAQLRQLVPKENTDLHEYIDRLTARRLGHSLAFLAVARTRAGRAQLAEETGIPEPVLLDLVRRADLSRLRLMSGGMIRQTWAMGYQSLSDLQRAHPEDYYARCCEYYGQIGKGLPFDLTPQAVASHLERMRQVAPLVEE